MAYYLSKKNKEIIELLIPRLRDATREIRINTTEPKALEYIIRNAGNISEYSWLKEKFTLRVKEGYLLCKLRNPNFSLELIGSSEDDSEENQPLIGTFTEIFNNLFNNKPSIITYENKIEESDLVKLEIWCNKHNYKVVKEEKIITFIREN